MYFRGLTRFQHINAISVSCVVMTLLILGLTGCHSKKPSPHSSSPLFSDTTQKDIRTSFSVRGQITPQKTGRPVNRLLLGSNLDSPTNSRNPELKLHPLPLSTLRYRVRSSDPPEGPQAFLSLTKKHHLIPVLSFDFSSDFSSHQARFLNQIKINAPLYMELGQEPYFLKDAQAKSYYQNINHWIRQTRSGVPSAKIGVPLIGSGVRSIEKRAYDAKLLTHLTEPIDFVSLHSGYLPMLFTEEPDPSKTYWATMAAAESLKNNLNPIRQTLDQCFPKAKIPIALTEYSAFYTQGVARTDRLSNTPAGAIYIADLLRVLAEREDVLMAHHTSLKGKNFWSEQGKKRLAFDVLSLYDELLHGHFISLHLDSPSFSGPGVGLVPAFKSLPRVVGLATQDENQIRILLINKSMKAPADVTLTSPDFQITSSAFFHELSADGPWSNKPWYNAKGQLMKVHNELSFRLEPHSVFLLTFTLSP